MLRDCDQIIWQVLVLIDERNCSSFGYQLRDPSLQSLLYFFALTSLLVHSFLHLFGSLELFDDNKLIAKLYKLMRVFFQTFFWESNMHLISHPFEIQMFISNQCILIEHLVEFTQLEKDKFVEILAFNAPVLLHGLGESLNSLCWDHQSRGVVVRVVRPASSRISAPLWSRPIRSYFDEFLWRLFVVIRSFISRSQRCRFLEFLLLRFFIG